MATVQQRVTLPASLMEAIRAISSDETMPPGHRLNGVLILILGWAWYETQTEVDPTSIAVPSAQWQEVCGMLTHGVAIDSIAGVNLGLSFMNQGPSSYKD